MRRRALAPLLLALAACAHVEPAPPAAPRWAGDPAGEWIDVAKSTPADTLVWQLAADGDDALLVVHAGGRTTRRHVGRWSVGRTADGAPALCFVRRPGRDAPSCHAYALDDVPRADGGARRRLVVRGYAGAHRVADRVLLARRANGGAPAPLVAAGADAAAAGARAFHPRAVQPERPSVATHAGTVARGYAELETGVESDRAGDGTHATQLPNVLKLGLGHRAQLAVTLPATASPRSVAGLGDVALGLKWRIVQDDARWHDVALLPQLKLATGGPRGTGTTDVSLLLIQSRTVGAVGLDVNLGATWRSGDGRRAPRTATLWTAAAGIPVHRALGWALECYGYPGTRGPAGAAPIVALLTGPTLALRPALALDAGTIVPLAGPQPRALYAGLVTSLGRFAPTAVR